MQNKEKEKIIIIKQDRINVDSLKIVDQVNQLNALTLNLEDMKAKADSLQLNVDSLQALIVDIEKLKTELKTSRKNAAFYQIQVDKFKADVAAKETQINQLIAQKDSALAQVQTLETEKKVMNDTLSRMTQERSVLKEKVAIASILKAEEFNVVGINHKGKEAPGPLFKNKQVAKLKIVFNLAENKVAPQNGKAIVMRLIEPDGTVLFSGSEGGSFTDSQGEEKMYTMSSNVQYAGTKQKISFMYQKGNEYKPGKHAVEVYQDGHLIGNTSFDIK
jgi:cell division protein ZapB